MSATEIINELPKLTEAERRATQLAQQAAAAETGLVSISPAGTPRRRENRDGLSADAGTFLGLEPAG